MLNILKCLSENITYNINPASSYVTISASQECGTKRGDDVTTCSLGSTKTRTESEALCSELGWCVAYSHRSGFNEWSLVTSTGSCPAEYRVYPGTNVTSSDQLAGNPKAAAAGWRCNVKPTGNIR